jgi:antitoxin FitA
MRLTCDYRNRMSKMIQIRNVPDSVHRRLRLRAIEEGVTLSDLLAREARQLAERPTLSEMRVRLLGRERMVLRTRAARIVRGARGDE